MLLKLLCLVAMVAAVPVPELKGAPADQAIVDYVPPPPNRVARTPEDEPAEEQPHEESADAHAPSLALRQAPSGGSGGSSIPIIGWIPYQQFFSGIQGIPTQIQSSLSSIPGLSTIQGIPSSLQSSFSNLPGLSSLTSSLPSISSIPGLSNLQSTISGIPFLSFLGGGGGGSGKVVVPVVRSPYLVYAAYPAV